MGFYIDWGTDVIDPSAGVNTAAGGDNIKMTITLNVATVGLSTAAGAKLDADAVASPSTFKWYIAMMNGAVYSQNSSDIESEYGDRYFDLALGTLQLETQNASPDSLTVNWASDSGEIKD